MTERDCSIFKGRIEGELGQWNLALVTILWECWDRADTFLRNKSLVSLEPSFQMEGEDRLRMLLENGTAHGKGAVCCAGASPGASWAAGGIDFPLAQLDLMPTNPSSPCSGPVLSHSSGSWCFWLWHKLLMRSESSQVSNCALKYKALAWKCRLVQLPFLTCTVLIQGCGSPADNSSVLPFSSTGLVTSWHRGV